MSSENDIGSKLPRIKNPFKFFGWVEIFAGLLLFALALYMLLNVSQLVKENMLSGWIVAIGGILVLVKGGIFCWKGTYKTFALVTGRNDPKSLAPNYANEEENTSTCGYDANKLSTMLTARLNYTFIEPRDWLENFLFSTIKNMFFLPFPYRNLLRNYAVEMVYLAFNLVCFLIVAFLCGTGLLSGETDLLLNLYTMTLMFNVVTSWFKVYRIELNRLNSTQAMSLRAIAKKIPGVIITPIVILYFLKYSFLSKNSVISIGINLLGEINWIALFLTVCFISLAISVLNFLMLKHKSKEYYLVTEVSEKYDNWQESVHPKDLFIAIENKVMASRRYMEVPNRVYVKFNPKLNLESADKGNFSGITIQETQPVYREKKESSFLTASKYVLTVLGNLLLFMGYAFLANIALNVSLIMKLGLTPELVSFLTPRIFAIVVCFGLGKLCYSSALLFWSELKFKSLLMYFRVDGTFTESKISTGMSVYDSTRSENSLVRSSLSPRIIVTDIMSSTFLGTSLYKFENCRYVMEMHQNDNELMGILKDLGEFLESRQVIADVSTDKNLRSAGNILAMNKRSRDVDNFNDSVGKITGNENSSDM